MWVAEEQIEFGCSFGDVICSAFESQARGLGDFMGWLAGEVLGSQDLAPGSTLWDAAIGETSNWLAIGILVSIGVGIIGISSGALSLSPKKVGWSLLGILSGIPATLIALTLGGALLDWSDQISDAVLDRFSGPEGFSNLFRAAAQGGTGNDVAGAALQVVSGGTSAALPTMLMLLACIAGIIVMSVSIAFRNLALMILIAFAPLAFATVGMKSGWQIVKKWATAGIALLISKPLMFGIVAMLLKTSEGMALFSPQTLTVVTGLFVAAFMPMMAYSFFNFLGASAENNAGANVASSAGQKGQNNVQRVSNMFSRGRGVRSGGGRRSGPAPKNGRGSTSKPQNDKNSQGQDGTDQQSGSGRSSGGSGKPGQNPQTQQPSGQHPDGPQAPAPPSGGWGTTSRQPAHWGNKKW